MYDNQGQPEVTYGSQEGLGGSYVQEGNVLPEGEEIVGQFQTDNQQFDTNDLSPKSFNDNNIQINNYIEKIHENLNFSEKEKQLSQKIDNFIQSKTGKTLSAFSGKIFLVNKIILLTTFTEFLFQRFDIVTLFISMALLFIEMGVFSYNHMYKWLLVLLGSLLLDAIILLDIPIVSLNNF